MKAATEAAFFMKINHHIKKKITNTDAPKSIGVKRKSTKSITNKSH